MRRAFAGGRVTLHLWQGFLAGGRSRVVAFSVDQRNRITGQARFGSLRLDRVADSQQVTGAHREKMS
jgi:hypothetical protein